ncbi:hypothetical protein HK101_001157 [Irineochytrium annulatum]|nr:hypothetical protein HK101_001157 [Irineochytrium annulatum]
MTFDIAFHTQSITVAMSSSTTPIAAPADVVELFDITSKLMPDTWSPNTAKSRIALTYMRVPHTVTFLSYPTIEPTLRSLAFVPNRIGRPFTCPSIRHGDHNIQDSVAIAEYLERTYPDRQKHPSLFPAPGSRALAGLVQGVLSKKVSGHAVKIVLPLIPDILDDEGAEYFRRTRKESFGRDLRDFCDDVEAEWEGVKTEIKVLSDALNADKSGPFFCGDVPSYADFVLVGYFVWFKSAGKEIGERLMAMGEDGCFDKLYEAWDVVIYV